jgi:hypothetical protein
MLNIDGSWNDNWRRIILSVATEFKNNFFEECGIYQNCRFDSLEFIVDKICNYFDFTLYEEQEKVTELIAEYWSII